MNTVPLFHSTTSLGHVKSPWDRTGPPHPPTHPPTGLKVCFMSTNTRREPVDQEEPEDGTSLQVKTPPEVSTNPRGTTYSPLSLLLLEFLSALGLFTCRQVSCAGPSSLRSTSASPDAPPRGPAPCQVTWAPPGGR